MTPGDILPSTVVARTLRSTISIKMFGNYLLYSIVCYTKKTMQGNVCKSPSLLNTFDVNSLKSNQNLNFSLHAFYGGTCLVMNSVYGNEIQV